MANPLTGDYEAVVQIAVRQIDALLATLHQRGTSADAPLTLLHSERLRVGDPPPRPPGAGAFHDWVLASHGGATPVAVGDLRPHLGGTSPPGVAGLVEAAFGELVLGDFPPRGPVRGTAEVQVSSPTVRMPQGSSSEVTVHAHIRARYRPDPDTADLPEPLHGEVRAAFDIELLSAAGGRRLRIQPSQDDAKIQFVPAPGSGLAPSEAAAVAAEVRRALREGLRLLPVDVPPDFPFEAFKGVGTGAGQALVLGLQLSGAPPPPGGLQAVTQPVVGGNAFAFAVRGGHVEGLVDLPAIRDAAEGVSFSVDYGLGTATYHLRFTEGPALSFRPGAIELSGEVRAETSALLLPNGSVRFEQAIGLALEGGRVRPRRIGDPQVQRSGFWFRRAVSRSRAVEVVRTQVDTGLQMVADQIAGAFEEARAGFARGLRVFDQAATASYTSVEITPDGVIARGNVGTDPRPGPLVDVGETGERDAFTALESWIPGGRVERLIWSWVEYPGATGPRPGVPGVLHPVSWAGVSRMQTELHRFVLPKPPDVTDVSRICLRIEGSHVAPDGSVVASAGGTTCEVPDPGVLLDVPPWWEPVTLPLWMPDLAPGAVVRSAMAAHVGVQSAGPGTDGRHPGFNTLVYFDEWRSERPLAVLGGALDMRRLKTVSPLVVVVVPPGSFDVTRRELDAKVASIGERLPVRLEVTEDAQGGWSRTFGPARMPAAYLVNARREVVWKQEGEVDPAVLAAALDEHLLPSPPPRSRPLRLSLSPGERAPDVVFEDHEGHPRALHRLRGRRTLLCFWQSWSAPCLEELERHARLRDRGGRDAPLVLAFHGGRSAGEVDEVHRRLGRTLLMAHDAEHRVSSRFGVRCWPTTVSVGPDLRIEHVRFGLAAPGEARETEGGYEEAKAYS
jgi:hypothetical protein